MAEVTQIKWAWAEQSWCRAGAVALPTPSCQESRDFSVLEQLVLCKTSDLKVWTFLFWP